MKTILLLTVLEVILAVGARAEVPIAWPGRLCVDDTLCDATNTGLKCVDPNEGCQCEDGKIFYFGSLYKCVIPVNGACTTGDINLTPNSECVTTKVVCKTGFVSNANGRCVVPPNADCIVDTDCDEDNLLICENTTPGKCGCSARSVLENGKCKLVLDMPCEPPQPYPTKECRSLCICRNYKCQCYDGLVSNSKGVCRVAYGGTCAKGEKTPCNEDAFQSCKNGVCLCSGDGVTSWYDGSKCVLLARSPCSTAPDAQICVARSSCVGFSATKECRCDAGYSENSDGHCI